LQDKKGGAQKSINKFKIMDSELADIVLVKRDEV
jgi:hypothetical protein